MSLYFKLHTGFVDYFFVIRDVNLHYFLQVQSCRKIIFYEL